MDSRLFNCWIVKRDSEYLQAVEPNTGKIVFSRYIFDACPMTKRAAEHIARRLCGYAVRFNHATGVFM